MQNYRNLLVWRKAHALAVAGYAVARQFPGEERFGLSAQLRRSLISISVNIAEGATRSGDRAFAAYLDIACGSAAEVENLLLLARDVGLLPREQHGPIDAQVREVRRLLFGLRQAVALPSRHNALLNAKS